VTFPTSFSSLKRAIPRPLKPAATGIYHHLFRLSLRVRFWFEDRFRTPRLDVPVPPAMLRYRVSELVPVGPFLSVGEGCAQLIRRHIDLANAGRVLDFGCGCGRTIRWLLDGSAEFHGVDVDVEGIDWCRKNLPRGHFLATAPTPPLPYPDEYFDVVYCFSVFTHLDEAMQDLWLAEMKRILKPGALLFLTVHGEVAARSLESHDRQTLADRGFVHKRTQKLKGLVPDWYQTTWHSREYIVNKLSGGFEDIRYHAIPDSVQDVVVARKLRAATVREPVS